MKKKGLALLMAATLAFGALVGCGGGDTSPAAEDSTQAAEDSASSDDASSDSAAATNDDAVANLVAATTDTVTMTVWASEEDQEFTQGLLDSFQSQYSDVTFDITLGAKSEADAKDDVLADVEAAPDVYAFAHDQINELVNGGALQEVVNTYTYDVKSENLAGSVEAGTVNGKLYAYPMTADNGFFLYYDKSVFTDVSSLDAMIEQASAANKKIAMMVSNGWYNYSFFRGAGFEAYLADDGLNTVCNWNAAGGTDVAQAIIDLGKTGTFVDAKEDADVVTGITDGTIAAAVSGVWNADAIKEAWGDNYAASKLPTFTVAGEQKQMYSFSGFKMIGVNPHSKNVGWAMLLAEYLTNADSQIARFEARGLGPANIEAAESDAVKSNPAIAALAEQAEYSYSGTVGGNYWDPAATLGLTLISGNPDGTDLQELLDNAVEGITAPAE
ncbi:MAG: extracellular solute-binding protein [Lachnospiraceae bacterium]|nr:extracellular solute-binding protein [Lachnospiraceae bacterium]